MEIRCKQSVIDLTYPQVMGVLNITPDSFSDGGKYNRLDTALRQTNKMIQAGATFIDVGGESTRPDAEEVSIDEELSRVIPVIEKIKYHFDVWVSVDTSKPEVMIESANVGADLINDVRAFTLPGALEAAVLTELPICLMHMQGTPQTMEQMKSYTKDIYLEVDDFFKRRIDICINAGIPKNKILLDPGFGFAKNLTHNYQLLARLQYFNHFGLPLLVGMSRKSMIGQVLNAPLEERLAGSLACAVIAGMKGANIIRVHDVKETVEVLRIVQATLAAS